MIHTASIAGNASPSSFMSSENLAGSDDSNTQGDDPLKTDRELAARSRVGLGTINPKII